MPRSLPPNFIVPEKPASNDSSVQTLSLDIQVVTPLFGGGVTHGDCDPVTLIRGTTIRGHLRFWWRFYHADRYKGNFREMHARESEVWGSDENPSPIQVSATSNKQYSTREPDDYGFDKFGPESYALFSAKQNNKSLIKEGFRFLLHISVPNQRHLQRQRESQNEWRRKKRMQLLPSIIQDILPDVSIALWTWIQFGGIGSRTRRGLGALHCVNWPIEVLRYRPPNWPGVVLLKGTAINSAEGQPALKAWCLAVNIYKRFRQEFRGRKHEKPMRNGKSLSVPGRSYWPEPDSIRKLTGSSLKPQPGTPISNAAPDVNIHDHSQPVVEPSTIPSFPRAVLGLPINFKFADDSGKKSPGLPFKDPAETQLFPDLGDNFSPRDARLASPVITKPFYLNGAWVPLIAVLTNEHIKTLRVCLLGNQADARQKPSIDLFQKIPNQQVQGPHLSHLEPMTGMSNALDALIRFAQQPSNNFKPFSL